MADVAGRFLEHVHHDPTIHLMCGLVAAGKTTPAARGPGVRRAARTCTELRWDIELNVLGVGASVVLDWNFWSRKLRQLADPGLELLDELTECAILGLKVDVARYAG